VPETPSRGPSITATAGGQGSASGRSRLAGLRPSWHGAAVALTALVWGLASGWWMPRGPLTNGQALLSVGLSVAVGGLAGWVSRSRWSMLVAPAVFVTALELARWGTRGPSVDGVHLSAFGVIALVSGRGVHGLLSVLPMVVGAAYGAGVARRGRPAGGGSRPLRYLRRVGTAILVAVVLLVTVAVAVPARTAPILGPDGKPLPRSVAEFASVDAGGHRLGMMIRGNDTSAPVLLFVPGTPGGSEIGSVRRHLSVLEQHFVVVTLDRRGGGKSYPALDPTSTVTLDGAVADTIAVTNYLRHRFRQEKIYLLGHSGGSLLGVLAVQRRPELYRAYIGTGQAVNLPATDRIFYDDILSWARARKNSALQKKLTELGPPPYRDFYSYEPIMIYASMVSEYDHSRNSEGAGGFAENLNVPEYTLLEKLHTLNAIMDTWSVLYPHMQDVDLRTDVRQLQVPVYFVQGAHEMRGLAVLFAQWYELLHAPTKHLAVLDTSGHRAMFEQPDRFVDVMTQMLAETRS
jgi:pimeloyl-ACP methyl ester carboxylesterase